MKNTSQAAKIIFFTLIFFISLDLLLGNYVYKKFLRGNFIDVAKDFGRADNFFHHNLLASYKTDRAGWGEARYSYCSDANSFRSKCSDRFRANKDFNIGFIGSSFTEGTGVNFEESYIGIIESKLGDKKIANLAIALYSSSIYFAKINHLLSEGYKFEEIIVFMDISEIRNETLCYKLKNNKVVERDTINSCYGENPIFHEQFKNKVLRFVKAKLKLSYKFYSLIKLELINVGLIKYKAPSKIVDNPEFEWTYKYNPKNYNNFSYDEAINLSLKNMKKLSKLLKEKKIKFSIVVYPLPGTIKNDVVNNKQVKIWDEFCVTHCDNFYNLMPYFFRLLNNYEFSEIYKKYFFENDVHINKNGHKFLAESFLSLYN
jgi:hypothetical protein